MDQNSDINTASDLSYDSSIDEKEQKEKNGGQTKNIQLFKEQMFRFMLTHPELQDEIKFDKFEFDFNAYLDSDPVTKKQFKDDTKDKNQDRQKQEQDKQSKANPKWAMITNNLIQESKRDKQTVQMPSIENFTQRMNLFRRKIEKPDVIEMIINNKDYLLKQIQKEEERKQRQQNKIHEKIEAKLRKETGDVAYYSLRKRYEFQFRIEKEEQKMMSAEKERKDLIEPKNKKNVKGPSLMERLMQTANNQDDEDEQEKEPALDIQIKTQKGEELLKNLKKAKTEEERKRLVIQKLIEHRQVTLKQLREKPSLISQGPKYSKEYSLLSPNMQIKKLMKEKGIDQDKDFFENRSNLEEGNAGTNVYLLTKVNRILGGSLMKKWKSLQDQKF